MPRWPELLAFRAPESFFYSVPQGDVRGLTLPWAGDLGPFGAHSRLFETVKRIKFRAKQPSSPLPLLLSSRLPGMGPFDAARFASPGAGASG
jgi:hypothetical protein